MRHADCCRSLCDEYYEERMRVVTIERQLIAMKIGLIFATFWRVSFWKIMSTEKHKKECKESYCTPLQKL